MGGERKAVDVVQYRKRVATDRRDLCGRREERARVLLSQHPFFALRIERERNVFDGVVVGERVEGSTATGRDAKVKDQRRKKE
jgi:hypothetical protein